MDKRMFFRASETGGAPEWTLDSSNSVLEVMSFKKISLAAGETCSVAMKGSEAILAVAEGGIQLELDGASHSLERHDAAYITNGDSCAIVASENAVLMMAVAAAEKSHVSTVVKRKDVSPVMAGEGCGLRRVWQMILPGGVEAERLIFGYCESVVDGGWTGWPPHEHGGHMEELYCYYDIGGETGGVLQVLSDDMSKGAEAVLMKDGDICAIKSGYHPVVALPGVTMKNMWFMAAVEAELDRDMSFAAVDKRYVKEQ